jgi:hypothetical protein
MVIFVSDMKRKMILILLTFMSGAIIAQSKSGLGIIINPVVQKIGNTNSHFVSVAHPHIYVNYKKKPDIEFGLEYHRKINEHWGWGVGSTWRRISYQVYYQLVYPDFINGNDLVLNSRQQFINEQRVSLRMHTQYRFNEKHSLNFALNFYAPILQESNFQSDYEDWAGYSSSTGGYSVQENIRLMFYETPDIVPELNFQSTILPNLNVVFGAKLKFWSLTPMYSINVTGYYDNNGSMGDILHQSEIDRSDFSYYFGFLYNIPFSKSK